MGRSWIACPAACGKETGLYYYGARYYDAQTSIWLSVDPLAEKFSGWTPYTYVFNNPIRFTDPTGMEGEDGVTDPPTKEQQAAMAKSDKDNGAASEKYAVRANRIDGNENRTVNTTGQTNGSKLVLNPSADQNVRNPEWDLNHDGKLSFGEADGWYKWGEGQAVHARLDKINLSSVRVSDFENPDFFKEGKPGIYVHFDGDDYVNRNQALVYGTISLVLVADNIVMSLGDKYDFDIKNQPGTFKRDVATILGQYYAGWGTAFPIHITGTSKIDR